MNEYLGKERLIILEMGQDFGEKELILESVSSKLLTLWPWASHLTTLSPTFLTYKMRMMIIDLISQESWWVYESKKLYTNVLTVGCLPNKRYFSIWRIRSYVRNWRGGLLIGFSFWTTFPRDTCTEIVMCLSLSQWCVTRGDMCHFQVSAIESTHKGSYMFLLLPRWVGDLGRYILMEAYVLTTNLENNLALASKFEHSHIP